MPNAVGVPILLAALFLHPYRPEVTMVPPFQASGSNSDSDRYIFSPSLKNSNCYST